MNTETTPLIREKAPLILAEIQKAKSILLHCHPSPDADSAGSALAMKFALEQMGKKATVIKGDSIVPSYLKPLPGAADIVEKNFSEIDLTAFDLFIAVDAASPGQVSRVAEPVFPLPIPTVVIDHHATNPGYGSVNLVETTYPATSQILFDLFKEWKVTITREIALNLFMGIHSDTGGFRFDATKPSTFLASAELVRIAPDFSKLVSAVSNANTPDNIAFEGLALSSVRTFLDGKMALAVVSYEMFQEKGIPITVITAGFISSVLNTVAQWNVAGAVLEAEKGKLRISLRSRDAALYDVSKLAATFGGGGHKAAAGISLALPIEEGVAQVVAKAKEMYNL